MLNREVRTQVRERAHNLCEYCHLHQDGSPWAALHVEHIIPKVHGGADDLENLALAFIVDRSSFIRSSSILPVAACRDLGALLFATDGRNGSGEIR